jgi:hypothetical protein
MVTSTATVISYARLGLQVSACHVGGQSPLPETLVVHSGAEWCILGPWPGPKRQFVKVSVSPRALPGAFRPWQSAGARVRTA